MKKEKTKTEKAKNIADMISKIEKPELQGRLIGYIEGVIASQESKR